MSVRVLRSPAATRNPGVLERVRLGTEDNLAWIARVVKEGLVDTSPEWSLLVLVGGTDPLSFRLRVAQSHVRHDLSPSAWSHVLFAPALGSPLGESAILEVSLAPEKCFGQFGFPVPRNGLQEGRLAPYLETDLFPNIALLSAPVASEKIATTLRQDLPLQRALLDVPQLILRWLGYGWGVGVPASPLAEGIGIPGAAILESAFAAQGFDLTPGLESRSSCPEAIWQAATWWHGFYQRTADGKAIKGAYCAKHDLVPDRLYGGSPPPAPARPPGRRPGAPPGPGPRGPTGASAGGPTGPSAASAPGAGAGAARP